MKRSEITKKLGDLKTKCQAENRMPSEQERIVATGLLQQLDEAEAKNFFSKTPRPETLEDFGGSEKRIITGGPATDKTFRGMFHRGTSKSLDTGGFKSMSEFLNVISSGRYDERLMQRASMVESVPTSGGFSVPDDFAAQWLDASLPNEIMRNLCPVWPMQSKTRTVPAWSDFDRSTAGTAFGGLKMQWLAEEGTGTKQTAKLRQISLNAHRGALYVDCSLELVQDGMDFETQLETALKRSIGYGLDSAFLTNGTGSGMPLSLTSSPALISIAADTGQSSGSISFSNVKQLFSRMYPAGRSRGVFLANDDAIPELLQIEIEIGVGGSRLEVFKETDQGFTIFGRPVIFSELMPSVAEANGLMFFDPTQYYIGMRSEVSLDKSNAPGWTQALQSYRVMLRVDGQCTWSEPITPPAGDTMSCIVGLAARP